MIEGSESTLSAPVSGDRPAERSAWQVVGKWVVGLAIVSGGLMVGAIVGLIVSLFTGLIEFRC